MTLPMLLGLALSLTPFGGPAANDTAPRTTQYAVAIRGRAHQTVHLRAVGVPAGYIASFCTPRVCAPFRVTFELPESGRETIELQMIENVPSAAKPQTVKIAADGARASIGFAPAHRK